MPQPVTNVVDGLVNLRQSLDSYNRTHGESGRIGQAFSACLQAQIRGETPKIPSNRSAALTADAEKIFHESLPLLNEVGLEIRSNAEKAVSASVDRESQELHIAVTDCERLAHALRGISPVTLENVETRKCFTSLVQDITSQFCAPKVAFHLNNERPQLVANLRPVLQQFERLGVPAGTLYFYIERCKDGSLYEHLLTEAHQLLDPPAAQSFGPSRWHTDCSPTDYHKKWRDKLQVVEILKRNERAQELAEAASRSLLASAAMAREQVEHQLSLARGAGSETAFKNAAYILSNGSAFLEVLEKATSVLRGEMPLEDGLPDLSS